MFAVEPTLDGNDRLGRLILDALATTPPDRPASPAREPFLDGLLTAACTIGMTVRIGEVEHTFTDRSEVPALRALLVQADRNGATR